MYGSFAIINANAKATINSTYISRIECVDIKTTQIKSIIHITE